MSAFAPADSSKYPARTASYTGTAGSVTAYPAGPSKVEVWSTTAAYVAVGEAITATTSNGVPLPANTPIILAVPRGTGADWRVSAIQIASGGNVYCRPGELEP